ncbi:protein YgfX, partial [Klebsiella pneumoniae]|uniref:protein YgfX n=1 Tax=Klebsiella pneumoniae TaxID=573 RepID=UPI00391AA625
MLSPGLSIGAIIICRLTCWMLVPWPLSYTPIWLLLSLVVFDCVHSQRRIHARRGEIKLLTDSRLRWQNAEWEILG